MFSEVKWSLRVCLTLLLASPAAASIPPALGFKTQEQIQAGLEVLTASSSQVHDHNQANQILDVYHNTPGMTVTPFYDPNGNLIQVVHSAAG